MSHQFLRIERESTRKDLDAASLAASAEIPVFYPQWKSQKVEITVTELFWIDVQGQSEKELQELKEVIQNQILKDPFKKVTFQKRKPCLAGAYILEKNYLPGVTDNTGAAFQEALLLITGRNFKVHTGMRYELSSVAGLKEAEVKDYAKSVFYNELIEDCKLFGATAASGEAIIGEALIPNSFLVLENLKTDADLKSFHALSFTMKTDAELLKLNDQHLWALNLEELKAIRTHYLKIKREPTDVELEVLAQTWSEHCKHKIFASHITVKNERSDVEVPHEVNSIFKTYIKGATDKCKNTYLKSVFHDNAGVISLNKKWDVAIKVETHNSPSALDPYGGSLTGIVGVNRDILGVGLGAKPVANLDVFCVGPLDYNEPLPPRLHHPRRILEGVRKGVEHGGNKSGIPTITGAITHHEKYLGKPLVYCGTIGVIPADKKDLLTKKIAVGDFVVMIGGRIGKDGIHGATFSSLELNESSPVSAVQLGDPLTQRRVWDFLIEARDLGLYTAITDNGAGGLSSSVGELSQYCGEKGGAEIDVKLAPTKYNGLKAFELLVSESQERMTACVPPSLIEKFLKLSKDRGVESTVLGTFVDSGKFTVKYGNEVVSDLLMEFLHDGVPQMRLNAKVQKPKAFVKTADYKKAEDVLKVLASPNVASRKQVTQSYDHEVQGMTVRKPYGTTNHGAPADGGTIIIDTDTKESVAVGLGLAPEMALYDAKIAAEWALDEALRNTVCAGGDPEHMVLVDNFCWPDPLPSSTNPDAEEKLGDLVITSKALFDASVLMQMPFVSGKDSMKNDYRMGNQKISVPPTVLITAMAKVPTAANIPGAEIPLSEDSAIFWCSAFKPVANSLGLYACDFSKAFLFYKELHKLFQRKEITAIHDVSDGGFLSTTLEMGMGTKPSLKLENCQELSYVEAPHSFVIVVNASNVEKFKAALSSFYILPVGSVTSGKEREVLVGSEKLSWQDIEKAYFGKSTSIIAPAAPSLKAEKPINPSTIRPLSQTKPPALVLYGDGIQCHEETKLALDLVGFKGNLVHVNDFLKKPQMLSENRFLLLPGGFSFGDELGSGQILALKLQHGLKDHWNKFLSQGGYVLGICNGFQVLTRLGVFGENISLCHNRYSGFLNRWVKLSVVSKNPYTQKLIREGITELHIPMRHGEGRLEFSSEKAATEYLEKGLVPFRYQEDVNGSSLQMAGLNTPNGRVLGMMPHPEAFWCAELDPTRKGKPLGLTVFESIYEEISHDR